MEGVVFMLNTQIVCGCIAASLSSCMYFGKNSRSITGGSY